jgi:hypothetical protein
MKFLHQILFLLITWFINLSAKPVFTKIALPFYEFTFSKIKTTTVESVVKKVGIILGINFVNSKIIKYC